MITKESIYQTYVRTVCSICKNKKQCQEELRLRIDNSIKCKNYETTLQGGNHDNRRNNKDKRQRNI